MPKGFLTKSSPLTLLTPSTLHCGHAINVADSSSSLLVALVAAAMEMNFGQPTNQLGHGTRPLQLPPCNTNPNPAMTPSAP
jgi:hypothetical protein